MTDEAWMAIFAQGSAQTAGPADRTAASAAFEELFHRYKQPLYAFFRRRTGDSARADELTQECFLAVLQSGERYRPTATFRTFLYAIGLNLVRADRRKTVFRNLFRGETKTEPGANPGTELSLIMRDALGRLEPLDREMLLLRQFEELSYAEIAELMKVPLGTVRSRLFRARTALREIWSATPAMDMQATVKQGGRA